VNRSSRLTRRTFVAGTSGVAAALAFAFSSRAQADHLRTAAEAYIFAYPLVLMDFTRQQFTATPSPTGRQAPVNQFAHSLVFPDHTFETVVSPNVDTLYSTAWLDLAEEPIVLSLPDTGDRYYVMEIVDAWTTVFAAPGPRTTGTSAGAYALVGPGWDGTLPDGIEAFRSPTALAWILGRTETNGEADYDAVHALQAQYTLTPLSAWGTAYTPPANVPVDPEADITTAPVDQVASMTPEAFWTRFANVMIANPPTPADAPMVEGLARLGIVAGQPLNWDELEPAQAAALEAGYAGGVAQVEAAGRQPAATLQNGWAIAYDLGDYGTDYLRRAATAWVGVGANLPEDAIYPITRLDSEGEPLNGANRYLLRFAADELPPANGFWSLTMYNDRQFLVENPLGRYAIRDSDPLAFGPDGSLEILIQHDAPGPDLEANWLPAPADAFNLVLRLYWPQPRALDGSWIPPAVTKVD
jgi:hypothetical protein